MKSSYPRELTVLKLFTFFSFGSVAILFVYFPVYFSQQGLSKLQVGMIMAGGPFISIIANPFWGYVSDKYQNIRRTIVLLLAGSLIVVQAVLRTDLYVLLIAAMLLFFFFQSPLASQGNSLILNTIEGTGYKFGSFRSWGSIGYAVVAIAAGPVFVAVGMDELWIVYSLLLIVSLIFTAGMPIGIASGKAFSNKGYGTVFTNPLFLIFVLLGVLGLDTEFGQFHFRLHLHTRAWRFGSIRRMGSFLGGHL
ncbi:MFS transporter [Cohnella kolymensis]|uniref:MFS transporter n=1 Tax=Cohnella kolymensis TaxID=1590652 RepID=UPI000B011839|nr:MFS transporter [Cohnella kolymensis]